MADLIKLSKDGEKNQIAIPKDVEGTTSAEEEEEEELFEIDLEAVSEMYSPALYWESYDVVNTAAATGKNSGSTTLFANCLLPIVQVSSAVPTSSGSSGGKALMITWPPPANAAITTSSLLVVESSLGEEFISVLPSFHFFASQYKKNTKAV